MKKFSELISNYVKAERALDKWIEEHSGYSTYLQELHDRWEAAAKELDDSFEAIAKHGGEK